MSITILQIASIWISGIATGWIAALWFLAWRDRRRPPPF